MIEVAREYVGGVFVALLAAIGGGLGEWGRGSAVGMVVYQTIAAAFFGYLAFLFFQQYMGWPVQVVAPLTGVLAWGGANSMAGIFRKIVFNTLKISGDGHDHKNP